MDDHSTDIFGPVEENSDDNIEGEEDPEEEQENDEISSIFEEEGEVENDKRQTMIHGVRYAKKWDMISKNST